MQQRFTPQSQSPVIGMRDHSPRRTGENDDVMGISLDDLVLSFADDDDDDEGGGGLDLLEALNSIEPPPPRRPLRRSGSDPELSSRKGTPESGGALRRKKRGGSKKDDSLSNRLSRELAEAGGLLAGVCAFENVDKLKAIDEAGASSGIASSRGGLRVRQGARRRVLSPATAARNSGVMDMRGSPY